ncbi:MAG: hypothetical protein WB816_12020 [Methylocystis sp.]
MTTKPTAIVHFDTDGGISYRVCGARLLIVDDRTPDDHVYEITTPITPYDLAVLLRDVTIGNAADGRSDSLLEAIEERLAGPTPANDQDEKHR